MELFPTRHVHVPMTASLNITRPSKGSTGASRYQEIQALHRRCGVYTKPDVVSRILDAIGWREDSHLSQSTLLEPAAGNGAFVAEAARRLIASFRRHSLELKVRHLKGRISAFELHPGEARRAQKRVVKVLRGLGVHKLTAESCARVWIVNSDFLMAKLPSGVFSHAVGNPPYVRWSKIPPKLKAKYTRKLARVVTGGDLFLPFLDRALELLRPGGRLGFLCSDRWRFMAFADGFRNKWLPRLKIESEDTLASEAAFEGRVDSYPSVLIGSKRARIKVVTAGKRRGKSLVELGCVIRVGPALGHTPAFVLERDEHDVEPQVLRPWVDGSEIREGVVAWRGRRVICMNQPDGQLVDLRRYPRLKRRLERHGAALKKRSIVALGAEWFRPIDRVRADTWMRPKLLVPELARVPRLTIDRSGTIPSHGVYAIFVPDDDVDALYERLRDGKLGRALKGIAPMVKGNYVRCYRRFLSMVRV